MGGIHPAYRSIAAGRPSKNMGLHILAPRYEAFIVDVWGVLCDGKHRFPKAIEALDKLRAIGPIVLLSNTARRATALSTLLSRLGIGRDCYDVAVTAGEICHAALKSGSWNNLEGKRSRRLYYLGPERDRGILDATGAHDCGALDKAGAILCTGLLDGEPAVDRHISLLKLGLSYDLPVICANPDKHVWSGRSLIPCAGLLAELYESMQGKVIRFGKPEAAAYDACLLELERLKPGMTADRILAIGDGLETDIAGAATQGISSLLVETGLCPSSDLTPSPSICRSAPTYTLPDLSW